MYEVNYYDSKGYSIATSELCDLHVLVTWAEKFRGLSLTEYRDKLKAIPNTKTAINIIDTIIEHYDINTLVDKIFLGEDSEYEC